MTTFGDPLRQSQYSNAMQVSLAYPRNFQFWAGPADSRYAVDLRIYDSINAIVFDPDGNEINNFLGVVETDPTKFEPGADGTPVPNIVKVAFLPTGTPGDYFFYIVGPISTSLYELAQPARIGYYAAPPIP